MELANWLDSRKLTKPIQPLRDHPNLKQWMDKRGQQQRDWIDKDHLHLQIADSLRKFIKPNAQLWETANFDVLLVGTQFKMWHRTFGPTPMTQDEVADLEVPFRTVRERRAQKSPARGLWFSAWVRIGSQGGANICCNFMDEPKIGDEKPVIPASDYERDFIASPRSTHWIPEWLK